MKYFSLYAFDPQLYIGYTGIAHRKMMRRRKGVEQVSATNTCFSADNFMFLPSSNNCNEEENADALQKG